MSCNCKKNTKPGEIFVCTCDEFEHPVPLNIGAGLNDLPRQIAGFPEFRRAMLRSIDSKDSLSSWRARDKEDLGIMLLEMWAYLSDSLSFYDKAIAQETYIRTANLRPSLRKLIALLGYRPRPSIGSLVNLAAMADGRSPIALQAGIAFRSGSFGENPPQVFELNKDSIIHPFNNKWALSEVRNGKVLQDNPDHFLIESRAELKPFSHLLLLDYDNPTQAQALRVKKTEPYSMLDGTTVTKLFVQAAAIIPAGTPLSRLWLLIPEPNSAFWRFVSDLDEGRTDDAFERLDKNVAKLDFTENDNAINNSAVGAKRDSEITAVSFERSKPNPNIVKLALRLSVPSAGTLVDEPNELLYSTDELRLISRAEKVPAQFQAKHFGLIDKNFRGIEINGNINFSAESFEPGQGETWDPGLTSPVEVYGNMIEASRGETIRNEIVGSGDALLTNQTFKLQKKPLTYFLAPTSANYQGVQNTLRVYVNGVRWTEVPSFYGRKPDDEIYIVRQNDEEESQVTFGDGIRGKRVPSGTDNIIAFYRYGAGKASPPSGSISQVQSVVPGLQGVKNPLAAAGGDDAEKTEGLRTSAPKTALILGRAVSIQDMEAVALSVPGVQAVQAEWRWHGQLQTAVVHIWYIGEAGIEDLLTEQLRGLSDPTVQIAAEPATPLTTSVKIDIEIDPRYLESAVLNEVRTVLTNSESGLLAPENIGIGRPVFRSRLFKEVISVNGVLAVNNIAWDNQPFADYALPPGSGKYFHFENNAIILNGES